MRKIFLFLGIIVLLPFLNAKIILLESPEGVYNIGDLIHTNFSIESQQTYSGYIDVYLYCNEGEFLVFKEFKKLIKDKKEFFLVSFIPSLKGDCYLKTSFNKESENSNYFVVSDNIKTVFDINNKFFLPSEKLIINGTAIKEKGERLNGIVRISLESILNQTIDVLGGNFYFEFVFPEKTHPGIYNLKIDAFEKNFEDKVLNSGSSEDIIIVKAYPTLINISSFESLKPPYNLSIKARLLDQVDKEFENETILIRIFDPNNEIVFQSSKKSGEEFSLYFLENALRGGWKINVYYGQIFSTKPIYVEDNKEISVSINPSKGIYVINRGNIDYNGVIEVLLENSSGNMTIPLNVNLSLGDSESYDFNIQGDYNLSVEGNHFENIKFSPITGAAISTKGDLKTPLLITLFLIAIILLFFVIKRLLKKEDAFFEEQKNTKDSLKETRKIYLKPDFDKTEINLPKKESPEINKPELKYPAYSPYLRDKDKIKETLLTKKIYSIFLNSPNFEGLKNFFAKRGLKLHNLENNISFALINTQEDLEDKLTTLIIKLRPFFPEISIILHSEIFNNNVSSIHQAFFSKQIIKLVKGVFITEEIYSKLQLSLKRGFIKDKKFKLNEKVIKLYRLV